MPGRVPAVPDTPKPARNDKVRRAARKVRSLVSSDDPATSAPAPAPPATPGQKSRPDVDRRFARSFWRVGTTVLGPERFPDAWEDQQFDKDLAADVVAQVQRVTAEAVFVEMVRTGQPVLEAAVATVRALIDARDHLGARAFALGLAALPEGQTLEHLGRALVMHARQRYQFGWDQFRLVEPELLARHAPREAVDCAFSQNTDEARDFALSVVADPTRLGTRDLPALAGRFQVAGMRDTARLLVEEADRRDPAELDDEARESLENQRRWTHPVAPEPGPEGAITVGVIDYLSPDTMRASRNVGDYVQTLAMLGNLARFRAPGSTAPTASVSSSPDCRAGSVPSWRSRAVTQMSTWFPSTATSASTTRSPRTPG